MREYKFRGKCVDNGEWVYGYYYHNKKYNEHIIFDGTGSAYKVEANTVGQYTGLKDKNGKEIYEGDIVTASWYDCDEPNHTTTGVVEFSEGWMAYWVANYENKTFEEMNGHGLYHWDVEVIGNVHENPELLEVES